MLNQCNFIGRLGKDPEMRYMPNGDAVANFSIALDESYKNSSGEKVEKTEWVNLTAYRKLAEICGQYLKKGGQVFVSGRVHTRKWQDKETGKDRYSTEFIIDTMKMLGGKPEGSSNQPPREGATERPQRQAPASKPADKFEEAWDDSDIPFN